MEITLCIGERLRVGNADIVLIRVRRKTRRRQAEAKIGVEAPKDIKIMREELCDSHRTPTSR